MSEELQQKLRNQLWTVANTLRGNMSAGDFMYYTLGFIFYKYLSEKIEKAADEVLQEDGMTFKEAWASNDEELKEALKEECIQNLGYFVEPEFLYSTIISMIGKKENILPALGNEMITLLKDTSLVSVIALRDVTKQAQNIVSKTYQAYIPYISLAIIYLVIVIILTKLLSILERRLRKSER